MRPQRVLLFSGFGHKKKLLFCHCHTTDQCGRSETGHSDLDMNAVPRRTMNTNGRTEN